MSTQKHIKQYLEQLARHYAAGHATEHTYRPALQALLESVIPGVLVTNEPKQIDCGAPDFVLTRNHIPLGYVEAKDIDKNLDDKIHGEQLARYTESLDNLLFTNYREFRLIRNAQRVATVTIAEHRDRRIKPAPPNLESFAALTDILTTFAGYEGQTITTAADLAARMAVKARMMAEVITQALERDGGEGKTDDRAELDELEAGHSALQGQMHAFRKHLIHDIEPTAFADIYAQTVAYGMFAARLHDPTPATFTRAEAAELIPANNPFLRKFFQHIAGYDLDARIRWIVDDLADVFRAADVGALMQDYGKATQRNDPFLHFYETFLGAYNPKLRKSRGVYYTPEPVVHFIVRAVDEILRTEFDMPKGLADTAKTIIEVDAQPSAAGKGKSKKYEKKVHRVQILDPATGTGTFLAAIVQQIYARQFADHKGVWPNYVREELIPRLNGFEVLMASYAMAHTKLEMVLRESGCDLGAQRLRIFLTNALEEHHPDTGSLFSQWLSTEANEANFIKRDTPVMVVIGNPPYAVSSSNKGDWIQNKIADYKKDLNERKINLDDDYIKFIRYGEHLIGKTGKGTLAYISNNSFLDGVTHRQMRKHLLETFDKIYILDLHGNARKKETAPDGSADKNVFDIMQGVSINLFVKVKGKKKDLATVFYHDLYGSREGKYEYLWKNNLSQIPYKKLKYQEPYYFFVPKNFSAQAEYEKGFKLDDLFITFNSGVKTDRDTLFIDFDMNEVAIRMQELLSGNFDDVFKNKYRVKDSSGYKITKAITGKTYDGKNVCEIQYRPFDYRSIYYDPEIISRPGEKAMKHVVIGPLYKPTLGYVFTRDTFGLLTSRSFSGSVFDRVFITRLIADIHAASDQTYLFPLYVYPDDKQQNLDGQQTREPNLAPNIVKTIAAGLGLTFTPEKQTAEKTSDKTFAPIDLLDYIYAVLHSPAYREKYKAFLKIDFPRVPYPTDKNKFRQLIKLGGQLRTLHLLESPTLDTLITGYPETGDHIITKPEYKITDPKTRRGNVNINKKQYFTNVPETAWNFHIGGYQPAQKWLKDRKHRELTPDDIFHYQKIIVALFETERLMGEIDKLQAM